MRFARFRAWLRTLDTRRGPRIDDWCLSAQEIAEYRQRVQRRLEAEPTPRQEPA